MNRVGWLYPCFQFGTAYNLLGDGTVSISLSAIKQGIKVSIRTTPYKRHPFFYYPATLHFTCVQQQRIPLSLLCFGAVDFLTNTHISKKKRTVASVFLTSVSCLHFFLSDVVFVCCLGLFSLLFLFWNWNWWSLCNTCIRNDSLVSVIFFLNQIFSARYSSVFHRGFYFDIVGLIFAVARMGSLISCCFWNTVTPISQRSDILSI